MKQFKALSMLLLMTLALSLTSCKKDPWNTDWEIINDTERDLQINLKRSNDPNFDTQLNEVHFIGPGEAARGSFQNSSKERPVLTDIYPIMEVFVYNDSVSNQVLGEGNTYYWELMEDEDRYQKIRFTYFE